MKPKHLLLLAGITIGVIIVAIFFSTRESAELPEQGTRLLPSLLDHVNDVTTIEVKTHSGSITLTRDETGWRVNEKSGYPADLSEVRKTLLGLANLAIVEPKTSNPDLFAKLNLQDVEAEGSGSTLITLKGSNGEPLAQLLIGKQRPSKANPTLSDIYVRKPNESQTWLVQGNLVLPRIAEGWINKTLLNISLDRLHRIHILHPDGDALTLVKEQPSDMDFHVQNLPKGAKIKTQFSVNNIATALATLTFEDVFPREEKSFPQDSQTITRLETFDGMEVTMTAAPQDNTYLLILSAAYRPDLRQEPTAKEESAAKSDEQTTEDNQSSEATPAQPPLKSIEDVQKEVAHINTRAKNWVFEIATFKVNNFSKRVADLIDNKS